MRSYIIEAVGTLFLTLTITLTGNALAAALMLASLLYIGGHISGGHYNPAVSFSAYLHGSLSLKNFFYYLAAQTAGAFVALILFQSISHIPFSPELPTETSFIILFTMEALLTMVLCLTMLSVTCLPALNVTPIYGVAIGFALGAIAFIGGLFNPAIALSSFFIKMMSSETGEVMDFVHLHQVILIHIIAPLVGGACAAFLHRYINTTTYNL